MNLEDVNITELRNSVNNCLSKLSITEEQRILDDISSSNVWDCSAKENLVLAMKDMINDDYQKITNALKKMNNVIDKIKRYQEIVNEIEDIQNKIRSLNSQKYTTYYDSYGRLRKKKNTNVINSISNYKIKLNNLKIERNKVKTEINSLISEM